MLLIVCQLNRYVSGLVKTLNVIGVFRTKVPVTFKIDSLDYEQSLSHSLLACENIRFSSLFIAEDVSRGNVLSDEERGETDVFAG